MHHATASLVRPREERSEVLVVARPRGRQHAGLQREHFVDVVIHRVDEDVDAERLRRELARTRNERCDLLRRKKRRTQHTQASGLRHGGDQFRARRTGHPCRHNGMLDADRLREASLDADDSTPSAM